MKNLKFILQSVLNSYAILFFSQNQILGCLLLVVSFFNLTAGMAGLAALLFSVTLVSVLGYQKDSIRMGFYSFNSLLLGIGMGTFYQPNIPFFVWLWVACVLTTMLSVALGAVFVKRNLPILSIPFVIVFWLLLSAANGIYYMGLMQKNSAILNEIHSISAGSSLFANFPYWPGLFFRALSAVVFQNCIISGIIISMGILIHSRIHFSLLVLVFIVTCVFNKMAGTYPEGISYYHLGSNIMMASAAIGCFFLIPSWKSYLWAIISIPVTILLINGSTRVFGIHDLPVLSLPFCITAFLMLYFFRLMNGSAKLQLTPFQHYSPERNLYQFINTKQRLHELAFLKLGLPFMGSRTVSQGYNGSITHKGDWAQALDFVITDGEGKTYELPGAQPSDYYCFNKPVLACADGWVEEVVAHVKDNAIGQANTVENWGNTIIIKHGFGLYSKVSHLKKDSAKVKKGDFVKRGELIGLCGNSGRSPEPHLHFQVQAMPYIGSKTIIYPFAAYLDETSGAAQIRTFEVPAESSVISPLILNNSVKQAFSFLPGYMASLHAIGHVPEVIEAFTDEFNQSYFYSRATGAIAYFVSNGSSFYFTSYYGDKRSLLYEFYLAAYKVLFVTEPAIKVEDVYPLQLMPNKLLLGLHDIIAPFYRFITLGFESSYVTGGQQMSIRSRQVKKGPGQAKQTMEALVNFDANGIRSFTVERGGKKTEVQWVKESMY